MQEHQAAHSAMSTADCPPFVAYEVSSQGACSDMRPVSGLCSRCLFPPPVAEGGTAVLWMQLCREHLGRHPCDKRRNLSYYKQQFPAVDFSLVGMTMLFSMLSLLVCACTMKDTQILQPEVFMSFCVCCAYLRADSSTVTSKACCFDLRVNTLMAGCLSRMYCT